LHHAAERVTVLRVGPRAGISEWLLGRAREHTLNAAKVRGNAGRTPELTAAAEILGQEPGTSQQQVVAHCGACRTALDAALGSIQGAEDDLFALSARREVLQAQQALAALVALLAKLEVSFPGDRVGKARRLAVALNLLAPGTGYLVGRTWLRAATALAVLALLLFFARSGRLPYLDIIFVGMQAVMGGLVYLQLRVAAEREAEATGQLAALPRRAEAPAAQVVCLIAVVAAIIIAGLVTERSVPRSELRNLSREDIKTRSSVAGIKLEIPPLGLSLWARGPGWTLQTGSSEFLFRAQHRAGGQLMLGVQKIYPFERTRRMERRLRAWLEAKGLVHQRTMAIQLNGTAATQMRFSGDFGAGNRIDHWAIAVPRPGFAFLLMLQCDRTRCAEVAPLLEESRDSFVLTGR
jgi:chromate transport protein ChrA